MAARKSLGGAGLPPLADLFSTNEERALEAQTQERVMMLPVSELHDFPGHPFRVRDDEEMEKLAESITQHGILMPGLVRPRAAGGYEIVAGHRRKFASMKAGIREMPVIVRDMDDDTAVILMVDSNVQRENVLPSEKARAYKMKLDAIKRKAGRPSKENSGQLDQNFFNPYSVEKIAQDAGESTKQVQRYIRLRRLLEEVDRGSPAGKRDYAIILLVIQLGLRVSDISNLQLESLKWNRKEIELIQHKTGKRIIQPLLEDVGWAIIDYIKYGRPKVESPFVFLTVNAPYTQMKTNSVRFILSRHMTHCGIKKRIGTVSGMHSLRHALARRLLEKGTSLTTVADVLGHTSYASTSPYLKVDIESLRECALSLEEVLTDA